MARELLNRGRSLPRGGALPLPHAAEDRIEPASAECWDDLERLFGARGACGGCWCMWYRLPRAEYERRKGSKNRAGLRRLLAAGQPVGVIAYAGDEPIGWCAVAPRAAFARLERARTLRPVESRLHAEASPGRRRPRQSRRMGVSSRWRAKSRES